VTPLASQMTRCAWGLEACMEYQCTTCSQQWGARYMQGLTTLEAQVCSLPLVFTAGLRLCSKPEH